MTGPDQITPQEQDFGAFADKLNQTLVTSGTTFAEQAFGLGCSLSLIPMGLVMLAAIILGARNWITISLVGLAEVLIAMVITAFFSNRARQGAIARVYRDEVLPEIHRYLDEQQCSIDEFTGKVAEHLPESALLVQHLKNGLLDTNQKIENDPEKE